MKKLVTGIKPTGNLTLGNYIGAIKNLKIHQKKYKNFIFIANLHSITMPWEKIQLQKWTKDLAKILIACEIINKNTILFVQSDILEVSYLGYILQCNSTIDELKKMTQFKDKSAQGIKMENGTKMIPTGLFTYPTLMAADILLYQANVVPVGNDQKQHLELTKAIGKRINSKYGNIFQIPQGIFPKEGSRIMSLTNPEQKMSKSNKSVKGTIFIKDTPEVIRKKIMAAKTDGENIIKYNKINKPGISNLIEIYASLKEVNIVEVETKFKNKNYKEFKEAIAKVISLCFEKIQKKYNQISNKEIDVILKNGAKLAKKEAIKTILKINEKMGINYE